MKRFALVECVGGPVHGRELMLACPDQDPPERVFVVPCACGCGMVHVAPAPQRPGAVPYQLVGGRYVLQALPPAVMEAAIQPPPQPPQAEAVAAPPLPAPPSNPMARIPWHLVAQLLLAAAIGALLLKVIT